MGGGKPAAVNAIVKRIINALVDWLHRLVQLWRIKIHAIASELIKGGVEHAYDFGTLVGDNGLLVLVPKNRNSDATTNFWIRTQVNIAGKWQAKQPIARRTSPVALERPAVR